MVFEAFPKATELVNNISTLTSEGVTLCTEITSAPEKISSSVEIPDGLFKIMSSEGLVTISPTISIPSAPSFTNPLDNIELPTFSVMDLIPSSTGSLLSMLMSAITMVIDSAIGTAVQTLNEALSMFTTVSDSIKDVMTWLWDYLDTLWASITNTRNIWENNKADLESQEGEVNRYKATLWGRALQWIDDTIKNKIGPAVTDLKNAVNDFVKFLEEAPNRISNIIFDLGGLLGDISNDWNTLTSTALMAVKYI